MYKLVLLRHGESIWNKANKFTGWTDVKLSRKGIREAKDAGKILKKNNFIFDLAYTSFLKRAIKTLWLTLEEMDLMWITVKKNWRLNERHYGALQGKNKKTMAKKVGEKQILKWRRSYDIKPPLLDITDKRFPGNELKYSKLLKKELPKGECLKDTIDRMIPLWNKEISKEIKKGKKILISAHGNSLRALVKHLENVSDSEITKLNIPTGIPLIYELDKNLKVIKKYYLADSKKLKKEMLKVKNQGKA